jgi:hypothetical protein
METGVAWCLTRRHPAEERLEGAVYALYHILHDLAVDLAILWHFGGDRRKLSFLLLVAHRGAALLPGFPAFLDGGVVDMAAEHEGTITYPLLFGRGLELVLVGFADALRCVHVCLFYLVGTRLAIVPIRRLRAARLSSPCL